MNCFVIWVALRQHVPLGARVQDPEHTFEDFAGRYGLASRTTIGNIFFREVLSDEFPLLVCQTHGHDR